MGENTNSRLNELSALFDVQLKTLQSRDTPRVLTGMLRGKKDVVIPLALKVWTWQYDGRPLSELAQEGVQIFLPVIPLQYDDVSFIRFLMSMVRCGEEVGVVQLEPSAFSQLERTPETPYYIFGVEDGRNILGVTPAIARERILGDVHGHPHVVAEDIALAVHTPVLEHHGLWSSGSWRRQLGASVPFITLDGDRRPVLRLSDNNTLSGNIGSAFCRERQ
ncbi:MAG: hypothetical protein HY457_00310 [Parcubacteria group bacterium]|nr:hypothetical protein [Parcubacteria group bacterium]